MTGPSSPAPEETSATRAAALALLGLAPGADERALKSAYARRLKTVRPDVDPEGFQALRAAYESVRGTLAAPEPETEARPAPAIDPAARDDLLHRLDARRRRGDAAGALAVVDAALSGGLDLAWRESVEDGLFDHLARDPSVRPELLRGMSERFAWGEATTRQGARDAEGLALLRQRIEGADIADALRARAEAVLKGEGAPGDTVLPRLLGPYRVGLFDRGLDDAEREVAVEVLNAVLGPLAEVDGLIDARILAALRGALGAAPLAAAPPAAVAPPAEAAEAASGAPINPPSKWNWSSAGVIWLAIVVLGNIASHWPGGSEPPARAPVSTPSPSPSPWPEREWAMRQPPVEMNFPVHTRQADGRLGLDLSKLLSPEVRRALKAVRIGPPDRKPARLDLAAIEREPIRFAPPGGTTLRVQLVFDDGAVTDFYDFDLAEAVREAASGSETAEAEDDPAPQPSASEVRFQPKLTLRDGTLYLDLSDILRPANREGLREVRLRPAPGAPERVLDWAAIAAAPLQPIPTTSERMTLRVVTSSGESSSEQVYDPRALLAARNQKSGRAASPSPEPSR
ncbi:hypothetical protein NS228_27330 [Methylobacterium indicum]|uniref:hypothetical protein n=1 Tax=Methylobacterium indicum TaxID=1775910 RepID=UPI000734D4F8|nr:hypothetical protein [Methylobacterium indicum]KTS22436.1 hypothetical protein NS228_27330 [Methylobacterium indicum]KTS38101.1 hypothetical protein NS229_04640 [Methylobacterium indicum]KTS54338.1 hypothetical protein NS230_01865 [Methylobacterium indicum]